MERGDLWRGEVGGGRKHGDVGGEAASRAGVGLTRHLPKLFHIINAFNYSFRFLLSIKDYKIKVNFQNNLQSRLLEFIG